MAVNCSSLTQIPIQKYGSFCRHPNKELKSKRSSLVPRKKAPILRITASIRNKVYEDKSQGIVCYQDDCGEIICEGYDEGPCFQRIPSPKHHHPNPKDAEIRNLLFRQGWLQIVKGEELDDAVEGLFLKEKEDLNCNGFNSFR